MTRRCPAREPPWPPGKRRRLLIGFRLAAQDYALALREVAEVLRVPTHFAEVPRTDDAMLGVIAFRDGLLPVVSLHTLLGLPDPPASNAALGQDARIVVTDFDGMPIGLLVDRVSGLLAVPAGTIDPVPPVLLRGGEAQIEGICRLRDGRLVALLSPGRLFDPATRRAPADPRRTKPCPQRGFAIPHAARRGRRDGRCSSSSALATRRMACRSPPSAKWSAGPIRCLPCRVRRTSSKAS